MNIKEQLRLIPELSGSYQFFDKDNNIIYVGKAKNLKRRVSSYFNKKHTSVRILNLYKKMYGFSKNATSMVSILVPY